MDHNVIRLRNEDPNGLTRTSVGAWLYIVDTLGDGEMDTADRWWITSQFLDDATLYGRELGEDLIAEHSGRWPDAEIVDAKLGLSYVRHRLGVRAWRFAHRFSIPVYVLAVWHTFIYGTDVWFTGYQRMALWAMQLP